MTFSIGSKKRHRICLKTILKFEEISIKLEKRKSNFVIKYWCIGIFLIFDLYSLRYSDFCKRLISKTNNYSKTATKLVSLLLGM